MVLSRAGDAKRERIIQRCLEFDVIVLKIIIARFKSQAFYAHSVYKKRKKCQKGNVSCFILILEISQLFPVWPLIHFLYFFLLEL